MIKGEAKLTITHDTLKAALQLYFEQRVFASGACPEVRSVEQAEKYSNETFSVTLAGSELPAASAPEPPSDPF